MTELAELKEDRIYQLYGINTAMHLLRPGAKWEIRGRAITRWDDPRPCPTWEEIDDVLQKILEFENSFSTVWTDEQLKEYREKGNIIKRLI